MILAEILLRRRWALARDLLLAGIVLVTMAAVLGRLVDSQWSGIDRHLLSDWGFPELRLACVAAVVTVAGPELVRPARLLGGWLVASAALGAVVLDLGAPSDVLAGLALGLGAGALVRLALGTAAGVPATARVQARARSARRRRRQPDDRRTTTDRRGRVHRAGRRRAAR